jgi:predicted transcriptional regulator
LATGTIERWSKVALARKRAEKMRGILQPSDVVHALSDYNVQGASFNPTELKLEAGLPEGDWMEIGRALAHVRESAHFWLGDWIEYGRKTYGIQTTLDLAKQATGLSENTLRNAAMCARRYAPEHRKPALSYMHHFIVIKYPHDVRDKALNEASELGLTTRQTVKAAEAIRPTKKKEPRPWHRECISIPLFPETIERLQDMASAERRPVRWLVARALEEWLTLKGQGDCIRKDLSTSERRMRWEAEGLCILCGTNEASEGRKTCQSCRETANKHEREAVRRVGTSRWRRHHYGRTALAASANQEPR